MVIFGLLFISVAVAKKLWLLIGFAGFLPVVSWVLVLKLLIINGISFSGCGLSESGFTGCGL
jgi:hypothetical protein